MRSLQEAFYNWLTIREVALERPNDEAANETADMFYDILRNQFRVAEIRVEKDEQKVTVNYVLEGEQKQLQLPRNYVESMINQMNKDPEKYK
ncbi:MAG TPA: hypothetical protein VNM69_02885 [Bacillus sp. (in: firmicutes)]|uniref:hypothetical protein n=1 Tax=Bacillus litorisediminis TaxID=2922713 RepID=UPI001FAC68A9|nr:hypothetical protein [Bacillus litorisediminis]HWO74845.1 hypothetical protein [Bacillus sp. (in: firmicutes)]